MTKAGEILKIIQEDVDNLVSKQGIRTDAGKSGVLLYAFIKAALIRFDEIEAKIDQLLSLKR